MKHFISGVISAIIIMVPALVIYGVKLAEAI